MDSRDGGYRQKGVLKTSILVCVYVCTFDFGERPLGSRQTDEKLHLLSMVHPSMRIHALLNQILIRSSSLLLVQRVILGER